MAFSAAETSAKVETKSALIAVLDVVIFLSFQRLLQTGNYGVTFLPQGGLFFAPRKEYEILACNQIKKAAVK